MQAMFSVKELRSLDKKHDDLVVRQMSEVFKRIGLNSHICERERIAQFSLEITHTTFLVVVHQNELRTQRTIRDVKRMVQCLLSHHLNDEMN